MSMCPQNSFKMCKDRKYNSIALREKQTRTVFDERGRESLVVGYALSDLNATNQRRQFMLSLFMILTQYVA